MINYEFKQTTTLKTVALPTKSPNIEYSQEIKIHTKTDLSNPTFIISVTITKPISQNTFVYNVMK